MNDDNHSPEKPPVLAQALSTEDRLVLKEIARLQIEGARGVVMYDDLCASKTLSGMRQEVWLDAVSRLDKSRLVKMRHAFGVPFSYVTLTELGSRRLADN